MVPDCTRRAALRRGGIVGTAGFAGCLGSLPFGGSEGPDAGRGSYGVAIVNELEEAYEVAFEGRDILEDEIVFEETATVDGTTHREWEQMFTEDGLYSLRAVVDHEDFEEDRSDAYQFSVGENEGPDVEHIVVMLYRIPEAPDSDETAATLTVAPIPRDQWGDERWM